MIGAFDLRTDGRRAALAVVGSILSAQTKVSSRPCQRVLVVRPDHLGDLLFLTPALRRLRRGLPDAEIVGLIGSWGIPVLERNPNLDRHISWEFPWFDRKPRRTALAPYVSLLRLARRLRRESFDVAVQFRADFWWGALACRLAGIPDQVGYAAPIARPFLTTALPLRHAMHAADENLELARAIAGDTGPESLEFPVTDAERGRAIGLIRDLAEHRPLVALQVGAGTAVKLWPTARLGAVGRALRDRFDAGIVVVGGPGEQAQVRQTREAIGDHAVGLAGVTTLGELAAVLERCAIAVGPDSGPLHLAVAVGTPTVHLFGPADARRYGPYGEPAWHRVIHSPRSCSPCNQLNFRTEEVKEHTCMADISIDDVVRVASELLGRSLDRRA